MKFTIEPQTDQDPCQLDDLLDRTFGPERLNKTVYRLRAGIADLPDLAFVAVGPERTLLASIRFWPILVESTPAILLGPLAVEPAIQGQGIGKSLVHHGLNRARHLGHELCAIVGDLDYYGPYGFVSAPAAGLVLPGPVDPARFLVLEIVPGALEGLRGLIRRDEDYRLPSEAAQSDGAA